ncbi:RagB/SusD family nutrient uptake outer membrane protein [Flavobacterium nitrogenifigens]|uniref:Starch-binding associating with outer membrane n=1 Tax=Flavobacterium nitrogenifigens TaxID=1617283 RepID=A0A521C7Q6_9FLAO|nr:RagB/SusD family nutrient uptake outer membrane protein [Flavobacterium nitrogenifigens]KAF2326965.1 RagB/SusD family nutrient uptake outer membrane protein [Flavobacterium nitrogenifigens]SMO55469.1 Starch-binding associating with outer membrane [Flavobacterium nitrogenifigens]
MKIKSIRYSFIAAGLLLLGSSCGEDFLTVEPKGLPLVDNYYKDESEAFSALVAVYDIMGKQSKGFENMITMLNAGSDDFYAGGGGPGDGAGIHAFDNYKLDKINMPRSYWGDFFQGIARANILLAKLPDVDMSDAKKVRFGAEAKALRGYFYFELVRTFKNLPLILTPISPAEGYKVTQVSPDAIYAQIEKDLIEAKAVLPNKIDVPTEGGRLSKGAVQALLGKVYLYEGKNSLAAAEFADVNGTPGGTSMYGYKLLTKFSDLWVISNKFNSEAIIEIMHTDKSNADWGFWGGGADEGNSVNIMVGPRGYERKDLTLADYISGWSFNPVTQSLYDALKGDPRFESTIFDLRALVAADKAKYAPGDQDTGYFLKKFMPLNSDTSTSGGATALNYKQDTYAIRLADTYLMEAEALGGTGARAQALLDAVRARVGLASVPVSLDAIANERRLELAGEGHRWFDLVRTGKAATVLASSGFVAGKNEVWPIPQKDLENTQLVQNPNY